MKRKSVKHRVHKKSRLVRRIQAVLLSVFIFFAAAIIFMEYMVHVRGLPLANDIISMEARNRINKIVFDTVSKAVLEKEVSSGSFYRKSEDENGLISALSVNTVLVNEMCGLVATDISSQMGELTASPIGIPIGTLTGIDSMANVGPMYSVTLMPMGNVEVDYETKFEAVGINQINFQVWLNVSAQVRVVNPMHGATIMVERKISLVNTVFSGRVPDSYWANPIFPSGTRGE